MIEFEKVTSFGRTAGIISRDYIFARQIAFIFVQYLLQMQTFHVPTYKQIMALSQK